MEVLTLRRLHILDFQMFSKETRKKREKMEM